MYDHVFSVFLIFVAIVWRLNAADVDKMGRGHMIQAAAAIQVDLSQSN